MIDLLGTTFLLDLAQPVQHALTPVSHSLGHSLSYGAHLPIASNGVFDLVTQKSNEAKQAVLAVGGLLGVVFVVWSAVRARGAIAGVVVAAIAAAIFLWVIYNVTAVQSRVGNEINSLRATTHSGQTTGQSSGSTQAGSTHGTPEAAPIRAGQVA